MAGNNNVKRGPAKDKPWAEALRMAVFREGEDGHRRLLTIAEKCADAALAGEG